MAKIKLPNGIEITLDTKEVMELIHECDSKVSDSMIKADTKNSKSVVSLPLSERKINAERASDVNFPTVDDLIKAIEDKGRPFSFNVAKELIERFGIRPRQDRYRYNMLHSAYEEVRERMSNKHKGHWKDEWERTEGMRPTKRFTLVEDGDQPVSLTL